MSDKKEKDFIYCKEHESNHCELNILCLNPSCKQKGIICYLCAFSEPHRQSCSEFLVPLRMVQFEENSMRQNFEILENIDNCLTNLSRFRENFLTIMQNYEDRMKEILEVSNSAMGAEYKLLSKKLKTQDFANEQEFRKCISELATNLAIVDKDGGKRWVYRPENSKERAEFLNIELQKYLEVQRNLFDQVRSSLQAFSSDMIKILDYKDSSSLSAHESEVLQTKEFGTASTSTPKVISWSPKFSTIEKKEASFSNSRAEAENHLNFRLSNATKQSEQNQDPNFDKIQIEKPSSPSKHKQILDEKIDINPDLRQSLTIEKSEEDQTFDHEEEEKPENYRFNQVRNENIEYSNIPLTTSFNTISNSLRTSTSSVIGLLKETPPRFENLACTNYIYELKRPEKRFDALAFYSNQPNVSFEGFGFYCPNPINENQIIVEYKLYQGINEDAKLILSDDVSIQKDPKAAENYSIGKILLKNPVKLEKGKYYTIVLKYLDEVRIMYGDGEWRNVGPFVFAGITKKIVKHWLNVKYKLSETEIMNSYQFPYFMYSRFQN